MSKTEVGVLILNEWFEAMGELKVTEFKKLVTAIYRYQILGEEPPEFQGKTRCIATMIFAQLKRRIALSGYGKAGAAKRLSNSKNDDESKQQADSEADDSHPSSHPSSQGASPLGDKEKKNKEKENKIYSSYPRYSANKSARAPRGSGSAATYSSVSDWDEFFESAAIKALGDAYETG